MIESGFVILTLGAANSPCRRVAGFNLPTEYLGHPCRLSPALR